MNRQNYEICLVFILNITIVHGLVGCADMPHTNPLDPENPDYQPPPEKKLWFTSIALQDDTVWFGSNDGGLVAFDGNQWRTYTMDDGLPDNQIQAIAAQGLNIWFTTYQTREKIVKFDGTTAVEYPIHTPIVSMAVDEDSLWIGGEFEIGTYDKNADSFVWYQLPSEGQLKSLLWDAIHYDTTSVSLYGVYETEEKQAVMITYGYSKVKD